MTPGVWGFMSFVVLVIAAVILYFSLRKQLHRVDFDEKKVNDEWEEHEAARKAAHHHNTPASNNSSTNSRPPS